MDRRVGGWADEHVDGWLAGRVGRQMDGRMGRWMDTWGVDGLKLPSVSLRAPALRSVLLGHREHPIRNRTSRLGSSQVAAREGQALLCLRGRIKARLDPSLRFHECGTAFSTFFTNNINHSASVFPSPACPEVMSVQQRPRKKIPDAE